jgi:hypothetical protein
MNKDTHSHQFSNLRIDAQGNFSMAPPAIQLNKDIPLPIHTDFINMLLLSGWHLYQQGHNHLAFYNNDTQDIMGITEETLAVIRNNKIHVQLSNVSDIAIMALCLHVFSIINLKLFPQFLQLTKDVIHQTTANSILPDVDCFGGNTAFFTPKKRK